MVPDGRAGVDAFNVIRDAMSEAGRVALARLVMGTRERVVAIEPRGRGMLMTTLRSFDEVRAEAELFDAIPTGRTDAKMVDIAARIIEQQEGPFDPTAFDDRYENALRALIQSKQDGGDGGVTAAPPKADNVIDLMEALRRSLEGRGKVEGSPPRSKPAARKAAPPAKAKPAAKAPPAAPPKPAPAKRRAAK